MSSPMSVSKITFCGTILLRGGAGGLRSAIAETASAAASANDKAKVRIGLPIGPKCMPAGRELRPRGLSCALLGAGANLGYGLSARSVAGAGHAGVAPQRDG